MVEQLLTRIQLPNIALPVYNPNEYPEETQSDDEDPKWTYSKRHTAQAIIPGLWVGPLSILRNTDLLEENNIRVLVSLTDTRIVPAVIKYKYEQSPDYRCYAYDPGHKISNPFAIVPQLLEICQVIDNALEQGVGVVLFCESGNECSGLVAASYLIYKGMEMMRAVLYVQHKRFSISFDSTCLHNLTTFQDICMAHRNVTVSPNHIKNARDREEDDRDLALAGNLGTHKRQI